MRMASIPGRIAIPSRPSIRSMRIPEAGATTVRVRNTFPVSIRRSTCSPVMSQ